MLVQFRVILINAVINQVLLPPDFHGLLTFKTSNSQHSLSPSLRARSLRVPCGAEEMDQGVVWYEINGPDGPSRAHLRNSNSRVEAGFAGEQNDKQPKAEKGCTMI